MVKDIKYEFIQRCKHSELSILYPLFRCGILAFSIIISQVVFIQAQTVAVGLMSRKQIHSVLISPANGKYVLLNQNSDTIYSFKSDDAISVSSIGNEILVKSPYGLNDTIISLTILGSGTSPSLKIRINSETNDLSYPDNLSITSSDGFINTVNHVNIERYVGRVVQAEVGSGANDEYYKIQSIICRTYATRNLERHALDGYDLCDHEHCQVYSGLKTASNEIMKATSATGGLVMVDSKNELILSAFHANCGGQTANSENVWKESRSYLTAVKDTFCLSSRSARWEKSIPLSEFLSQLGFKTDSTGLIDWSFDQVDRKKYFKLKNDSVETAQMRRLLQLRSAYFDVSIKNSLVEITGRGYGHGVGLCQQGAMEMSRNGYTYSQILGYYYQGVGLIPITSIQVPK